MWKISLHWVPYLFSCLIPFDGIQRMFGEMQFLTVVVVMLLVRAPFHVVDRKPYRNGSMKIRTRELKPATLASNSLPSKKWKWQNIAPQTTETPSYSVHYPMCSEENLSRQKLKLSTAFFATNRTTLATAIFTSCLHDKCCTLTSRLGASIYFPLLSGCF